jgi:hypothetical protein
VSYREAIVEILSGRAPEEAHWTVIWDEALRRGLVDPLIDRNARSAFLKDIAAAARDGVIELTSKGTYRARAS